MTDKIAILDANATFYKAFLRGDMAALERLWADTDDITCIHPGWPAIVGRVPVIDSWRSIISNPERPNITCHDPHAIATATTGHVVCIELIGATPLAASNHFRYIQNEWRLVHHQSSPIAAVVSSAFRETPVGLVH
jgi:hypothetical protein